MRTVHECYLPFSPLRRDVGWKEYNSSTSSIWEVPSRKNSDITDASCKEKRQRCHTMRYMFIDNETNYSAGTEHSWRENRFFVEASKILQQVPPSFFLYIDKAPLL